jgi:serine phosphatase RsbU (regulator of sigma subunit)
VDSAHSRLDVAAGMLAGWVGCTLAEAQAHLAELMAGEDRPAGEVAASIIAILETDDVAAWSKPPSARTPRQRTPPEAQIQQILDVLPGAVALWAPVRDAEGAVVDYVVRAASPEAVDLAGRRGSQLVGLRVSEAYPAIAHSERWAVYREVLATGRGRRVSSFAYPGVAAGAVDGVTYAGRVHRLGDNLLVTWAANEETHRADRMHQTERLGNLGWGEWDLRTGYAEWSDHLYRIYGRTAADGPATIAELAELCVEEDDAIRDRALAALDRGERIDVACRVRVAGEVRHLRIVADVACDATGRPIKVYGIVQDVTSHEIARRRLAEVGRLLEDQRRSLEAEHRLASQLQTIILPIPAEPFNLPGLRVALRYLPAEHLSHVGGDWYHAGVLPDGSVLLAVGDVAGHGLRAATTMAQLRHALRALTVTTIDPARLMSHLNRLMCDLAAETQNNTATAVIARYDGRTRTLTWAHAGHPVPLLSRGGTTGPLPPACRAPGLLLGVRPDAEYDCASVTIDHGDVLLFYTDGLVEHRRQSLDEGLADVIRTIDEAVFSSPRQPLSAVLARLHRANPEDDTCVLAARPLAHQDQV